MKTRNSFILLIGVLTFVFCFPSSGNANDIDEAVNPMPVEGCSDETIKTLEEVELNYVQGKEHWRNGDFEPYEFFRCDVEENRARLFYKKKKDQDWLEFYMVYFTKFEGKWQFEFNDIVIRPEYQKDGSETTIRHVLQIRNPSYWFSCDQ